MQVQALVKLTFDVLPTDAAKIRDFTETFVTFANLSGVKLTEDSEESGLFGRVTEFDTLDVQSI